MDDASVLAPDPGRGQGGTQAYRLLAGKSPSCQWGGATGTLGLVGWGHQEGTVHGHPGRRPGRRPEAMCALGRERPGRSPRLGRALLGKRLEVGTGAGARACGHGQGGTAPRGVGRSQCLAASAWASCGPRSSQCAPRTPPVQADCGRPTVGDAAPDLESVLCSAQAAQRGGAEQGPQDRTVSVGPLPLAFAEVTSRDSGPLSAAICIREELGGAALGGRDHLPVFQNLRSDKGIGPRVRLVVSLPGSQGSGASGQLPGGLAPLQLRAPLTVGGPPGPRFLRLSPPSPQS